VLLVFFFRGLFSFTSAAILGRVTHSAVYLIRRSVFSQLQVLPMSYFDKTSRGALLSKLTYDAEQVVNAGSEVMLVCLREGLIIVVLLAIMLITSWQLSLVFLCVGPLVALLINLTAKHFKRISIKIQSAIGGIADVAERSFEGHQYVLAFRTQHKESAKFELVNAKTRDQAIKLNLIQALSSPLIVLIASTAISGLLFLASFPSILEQLSVGAFTANLMALGSLLRPIKQLSQVNHKIQKGVAAAQSLYCIIDTPKERNTGTMGLSPCTINITAKNLSFSYPGDSKAILQACSLEIQHGKNTFFIGESGCGKSTLINLLLRFYFPSHGDLLVNGTDITAFDINQLRQHISIVSQNVFLTESSLRENILYACHSKVEAKCIADVLEVCQLSTLVFELEGGLDADIGMNGSKLSGGQRQRVAIARALMTDAPIMIFDEATSALDPKTEKAVMQGICDFRKGKTTLFITHKMDNLQFADQIYEFSDGKVKHFCHSSLTEEAH